MYSNLYKTGVSPYGGYGIPNYGPAPAAVQPSAQPNIPTPSMPTVQQLAQPNIPMANIPTVQQLAQPNIPMANIPTIQQLAQPNIPMAPMPTVQQLTQPNIPTAPMPTVQQLAQPNIPTAPMPTVQQLAQPNVMKAPMPTVQQLAQPNVPTGGAVSPLGAPSAGPAGAMGLLPLEQSYIENILRLNLGKIGTFYMTYENNSEWNAKIFKGRVEAAGRDHIILSDPQTGMRYLLLMVNLDYVTFEEELQYTYPFSTQGRLVR